MTVLARVTLHVVLMHQQTCKDWRSGDASEMEGIHPNRPGHSDRGPTHLPRTEIFLDDSSGSDDVL
jgi:hypothetical protein